jgi:hypothetical protein
MSENNITQLYPEQPEQPKKSGGRLVVRLISMILVLALVVGAVLLVLFWDDVNLDGVRRFVRYLNVSQSDTDGRFSFDQHSSNVFAAADGGLSIASVGGVTVYDKNGDELYTVSNAMSAPAVMAGNRVTLAYDIGGTSLLTISNKRGVTANVTTGGTLLDASISDDDAVAYCAVEDGKKTVLTVLNDSQQEIYKWYSSSSFLSPCAVTGDGSQAAAVSLGQLSHTYESTLLLFDTKTQDDPTQVALGNLLVYDLDYLTDDTLCAVGESAASFVSSDGTPLGTYSYSDRYLKDYDLGGDGFLTLSLNTYQAGSRYSLVTVDCESQEASEVYLGVEILSLSACGKYVAVLTVDGLRIYTQDLTLYAESQDTGTASKVLMRDDGTALLISGSSASLYIP